MNDEVRDEFESILRFWFDRGVDGFRIDVAHGLAKDPEMPDLAGRFPTRPAPAGHPHWDQDEVHEVYRAWRQISDSYDGERAFVGEVWVHTPEQRRPLRAPGRAAHGVQLPLPARPVGRRGDADGDRRQHGRPARRRRPADVGAVQPRRRPPRHALRRRRAAAGDAARAAALLMFALPGGAYVYQGEELGLDEVEDLPDEVRQDPTFLRTGGERKGRDGCRVPIPWGGDAPPFGFGPGPSAWLPQPAGVGGR